VVNIGRHWQVSTSRDSEPIQVAKTFPIQGTRMAFTLVAATVLFPINLDGQKRATKAFRQLMQETIFYTLKIDYIHSAFKPNARSSGHVNPVTMRV